MGELHTGVTFYEEDRNHGPFIIRAGGTNEFVSEIDPDDKSCCPPGRVSLCEGWDNTETLKFDTMEEALNAADEVWDIEGFHTSVEALHHPKIESYRSESQSTGRGTR